MKPLGQIPITFPSKTKKWFGKGIKMWWEHIGFSNKVGYRQQAKKAILKELP